MPQVGRDKSHRAIYSCTRSSLPSPSSANRVLQLPPQHRRVDASALPQHRLQSLAARSSPSYSLEISGHVYRGGISTEVRMPVGPTVGQPDRKSSWEARRRVERRDVTPGSAAGTPAFCRKGSGHPQEISNPPFSFSLPKMSRSCQRCPSGTGVAKWIQGLCPDPLPPLLGSGGSMESSTQW